MTPFVASSSSPMNENLLLSPALDELVTHLVLPLLPSLLSPSSATLLRQSLTTHLSTLFAPTWQPSDPNRGSGFRSLIACKGRLPRPLRQAAVDTGVVSVEAWEAALGGGEWQAWCDPGRVSWRDGGWEWEDGIFYLGGWKDTLRTIWAAPAVILPSTTPRLSHAITIRPPSTPTALLPSSPLPTPTTLLTPPTPQSEPPLPPLSERPDSPLGSESSSSTFTSTSAVSTTSSSHPSIVRHGHSSSISSMTSSSENNNNNHSRTRSSSPVKKPSVTAYDGGKVGVLGGGVKLGGGVGVPSSPKKQQSSYTLNNYLSSGQQQQQRGRKIGRQPGLFGGPGGGQQQGMMGPPPPPSMGLFAYRG